MTHVYVPSSFKRMMAFLIDGAVINIFWAPVTIQVLGSWLKSQEMKVSWKWVLASFLLSFGYKWFFNYFLDGTLGKLVVGLRLVNKNDPDGGLSLMQSLVRVLAEQFSMFFGFAPQMLMFMRFDRTHVADWVAETRVVQFTERLTPPHRRPVLTFFLCLYFFVSGFGSAYKTIKSTRYAEGEFVFEGEDVTVEYCQDLGC